MLTTSTPPRPISIGEKGKYEKSVELGCFPASARPATSRTEDGRGDRQETASSPRGDQKLGAGQDPTLPLDVESWSQDQRPRRGGRETPARSCWSATRRSPRTKVEQLRGARNRPVPGALHRQPERRPVPARHADGGQDRLAGRGDHGDLPDRLRPGDPPTLETATNLFVNLFFNPERYDLSKVGRSS